MDSWSIEASLFTQYGMATSRTGCYDSVEWEESNFALDGTSYNENGTIKPQWGYRFHCPDWCVWRSPAWTF